MSQEINETGCRMFAVEKAMQLAGPVTSQTPEQILDAAGKILAFLMPEKPAAFLMPEKPAASGLIRPLRTV